MILRYRVPDGKLAEVDLEKREITIGRSSQSDVFILNGSISRTHCRILRRGPEWVLEDCKSRNGTLLNGKKVDRATLKEGDQIQVGAVVISVEPRARKGAVTLLNEVQQGFQHGKGYKTLLHDIVREAVHKP